MSIKGSRCREATLRISSALSLRVATPPCRFFFYPPRFLWRIFHFPVFEDPACSAEQNRGLDKSHTRVPLLGSGCARRFVIMGRNLGHLGKHS